MKISCNHKNQVHSRFTTNASQSNIFFKMVLLVLLLLQTFQNGVGGRNLKKKKITNLCIKIETAKHTFTHLMSDTKFEIVCGFFCSNTPTLCLHSLAAGYINSHGCYAMTIVWPCKYICFAYWNSLSDYGHHYCYF